MERSERIRKMALEGLERAYCPFISELIFSRMSLRLEPIKDVYELSGCPTIWKDYIGYKEMLESIRPAFEDTPVDESQAK